MTAQLTPKCVETPQEKSERLQKQVEKKQPLVKTQICPTWQSGGFCEFGSNCRQAHGEEQLGQKIVSFKVKTKLCHAFHSEGFCPEGLQCEYIHTEVGPKNFKVTVKKLVENELNYDQIWQENL